MEELQRIEDQVTSKKPWTCICRKLQDSIPARYVLYFLSFSGFLVSFMMRTDINIAIIAMVRLPPPKNGTAGETLFCYDVDSDVGNVTESSNPEDGEFDWDFTTQSTIISCFYWWYILSQVAGGLLTQYFGTKIVFGGSQMLTALCSLLIPTAASIHYSLLIVLRSLQGIASGLTWPAMYAIVGPWIPPEERSRFMSSFQGFSFGIGITYPLCGFLIANFGWRVVFYVTGTVGMLWCILWWFLAYDTPALHPRISPVERHYIETSVGNTAAVDKGTSVPWRSIFTSMPAWCIGITTFGRIWVHYTFMITGPLYMKTVLGFSIQTNGMLSGAPFICSYLSSVVFCYLADFIVKRNLMTSTNQRKLFTAASQIAPGLLVLAIGYLRCEITWVIIAWFVAVTLITASYAGAMASIVDIAPNFAGPILAFAQTIHMSASFISPLVAGLLLQENPTLINWYHVFWVTAIVSCVTYIPFQIYGTAEIQPWNYPNQKVPLTPSGSDELLPLQKPVAIVPSHSNGEVAVG